MCIEDLTALKIILTSLGTGQNKAEERCHLKWFGIKMIRICSYHW